MKILAAAAMASALMAGSFSFAADRTNATEGNKSEAKKTMQNHSSDKSMRGHDSSAAGTSGASGGGMQRNNAVNGDKSEGKKTMQNQPMSDTSMRSSGTSTGANTGTYRQNATEGDASQAPKSMQK